MIFVRTAEYVSSDIPSLYLDTNTDRKIIQFKVKLCEGSMDGPRKEDVHWLDFQQLRAAITGQSIAGSLAGDIWSLGTTLWEIFSYGEQPLSSEWSWMAIAEKYLNGIRLQWPNQGTLTLPLQVMMMLTMIMMVMMTMMMIMTMMMMMMTMMMMMMMMMMMTMVMMLMMMAVMMVMVVMINGFNFEE